MGTQPKNTHGIQTQTQPIPKIWFGFGYYPWVPEFWVPNPRSTLGESQLFQNIKAEVGLRGDKLRGSISKRF